MYGLGIEERRLQECSTGLLELSFVIIVNLLKWKAINKCTNSNAVARIFSHLTSQGLLKCSWTVLSERKL